MVVSYLANVASHCQHFTRTHSYTVCVCMSVANSCTCTKYSEVWRIFTRRASVIVTSSLRTCCWTLRLVFSNSVTSAGLCLACTVVKYFNLNTILNTVTGI